MLNSEENGQNDCRKGAGNFDLRSRAVLALLRGGWGTHFKKKKRAEEKEDRKSEFGQTKSKIYQNLI